MRRIRAIVSGRVQGVSYRASAAKKAAQLGLVGWVRNLANGDVELEAEGSNVDELVAWCKQGPPAAQVDRVTVEEIELSSDESTFDVRY